MAQELFSKTDLLTDIQMYAVLNRITGYKYEFASVSGRRWGKDGEDEEGEFFQLMPFKMDDGFFDWYCLERVNDQFFATKQDCTLNFLKYWHIWKGQWKVMSK